MRTHICIVVSLLASCAASTAVDEEPLIVAKPFESPRPEKAWKARQAEKRRTAPPVLDKVVAMPLSSAALDADVVGSLDRLLVTRLADDGTYDVISPADIGSLLGAERLKDAVGCSEVTCAADFAGALDARFVLYGVIDELGGRLNITLSLVDAREQRVHARSQVTVDKNETAYGRAIDAVVARLLGDESALTSIAARPGSAPAAPDQPQQLMKLDPSVTGSIFVDIPERMDVHGQYGATETRRLPTRDAEAAIIGHWTRVGFDALERLVVPEPSLSKLKELGATYWIVGEASCADFGSIMGTSMHSLRADIAARAIDVATGKVVATAKESQTKGHINVAAGARDAMVEAATRCADTLLRDLVTHLQASQ